MIIKIDPLGKLHQTKALQNEDLDDKEETKSLHPGQGMKDLKIHEDKDLSLDEDFNTSKIY